MMPTTGQHRGIRNVYTTNDEYVQESAQFNATTPPPRRGGGRRNQALQQASSPSSETSSIYTVITSDLQYFADNACSAGKRAGSLPYGALIVGSPSTSSKDATMSISFPMQGYLCSPLPESVVLVDHHIQQGKGGSIQSNHICALPSSTGSTMNFDTEPVWEAGKHILASCTLSMNSEWTKQWNVGNGGLGAMVGGRYSWEGKRSPVRVRHFLSL